MPDWWNVIQIRIMVICFTIMLVIVGYVTCLWIWVWR